MAKKPKKEVSEVATSSASDKAVNDTITQLEKQYGKGLIVPATQVAEHRKKIFSVGPAIDNLLGGGIPEGTWVSVSGPPKGGKTTAMLSFLAECQRHGRFVVYANVEYRLKMRDISGIKGLNLDESKFKLIQSKKGQTLSTLAVMDMVGKFVSGVPGCVILLDSISALCNPTVLEGGLGKSDHGSNNKIVAQFCDIYASQVPINDCIVIGIIHNYANTSGYGPASIEKAANRWKYQADVALQIKGFKDWRAGGNETPPIGIETEWLVKTSAIGPPGQKGASFIRFGTGIDKMYEITLLAQDMGFITGSGWYTLNFLAGKPELLVGTEFEGKEEVKVQGAANVSTVLDANPKWVEALKADMREMLGT